jgi:hypothetical protein
MARIGVWQITGDRLDRLEEARIALEEQLEGWISADPSLIQNGLVAVGRQIRLAGGVLDLLCLDPQGRWVALELKRRAVSRATIAQVVDYASCLSLLSADELREQIQPYLTERGVKLDALLEERGGADKLEPTQREILLFVVGTGRAPELQRVVQFLFGRYGVPISVVLFDVFKTTSGDLLLVRETAETESIREGATPSSSPALTVDAVLDLADNEGTGEILRRAVAVAGEKGLGVRPYRTSLMFTPPSNRTRMLFTIWVKPDADRLRAYVGVEPFTEFFPVERELVERHLGAEGWRTFSPDELSAFLAKLEALPLASEYAEDQSEGAAD